MNSKRDMKEFKLKSRLQRWKNKPKNLKHNVFQSLYIIIEGPIGVFRSDIIGES